MHEVVRIRCNWAHYERAMAAEIALKPPEHVLTAPYLYDGRALTMEEVLTICNPNDKHGETSKLTREQIKDLAEYVLSL